MEPRIHRLELPTPYNIGTVNVYAIDVGRLTLVDCGPAWTPSLRALSNGLASLGRRIEDIELLVLTHQHADHLGLARMVVELSGAEVAALDLLAPMAAEVDAQIAEDDDAAATLMQRHGVPVEVVEVLRAVTRTNRFWAEPVHVDRLLPDGSTIDLGTGEFRVVHAPGHSPTDTLFVDESSGIVFGGDHLLANVSSNALVSARPPGQPRLLRYPALREYGESLRRTRMLEVAVLFAGHGPPIEDHRALIDRRLAEQARRADRILAVVEPGPRTAHEIAVELWGRRALTQAYLATSDVLGHVDLLLDAGRVRESDDGEVVRYSAI